MHEVQIEKLRWLLRDLGIDAEFQAQPEAYTIEMQGRGGTTEDMPHADPVDGIFLSYTEADRLIDLLRSLSPVAA